MSEGGKNYFHSLDALRFFAFVKVFIFHIPLFFVATEEPLMAWHSDHIF
jgi:peptidoglycan/LPS O-acetylase OafA/YrhL